MKSNLIYQLSAGVIKIHIWGLRKESVLRHSYDVIEKDEKNTKRTKSKIIHYIHDFANYFELTKLYVDIIVIFNCGFNTISTSVVRTKLHAQF